jgi:hypothetical protein
MELPREKNVPRQDGDSSPSSLHHPARNKAIRFSRIDLHLGGEFGVN